MRSAIPDPSQDPLGWIKATIDDGWPTTAQAAEALGITPGRLCCLRRQGRTPVRYCCVTTATPAAWTVSQQFVP